MVVVVLIAGANVGCCFCYSLSINKCAMYANSVRCFPFVLPWCSTDVSICCDCSAGHQWSLCVGTVLTVEGDLALLSGVFFPLVAKMLSCSSCHSGQNRFHLAYSATGSSETLCNFRFRSGFKPAGWVPSDKSTWPRHLSSFITN